MVVNCPGPTITIEVLATDQLLNRDIAPDVSVKVKMQSTAATHTISTGVVFSSARNPQTKRLDESKFKIRIQDLFVRTRPSKELQLKS